MEVFCGMGCSSSVTNKGPPIICTLVFVKPLDEGTVRGRYFYDANATFTWNGQL